MAFYSIDRLIEEEDEGTCPYCGAASDVECPSWDEED